MLTDKGKEDLLRRCEVLMKYESMTQSIDSPARILRDLIRHQATRPSDVLRAAIDKAKEKA